MRHAKNRAEAGSFLHQREILRGQGLQGKAAFAAFEHHFFLLRFKRYGLVGRHGAQNINQLACAYGGLKIACFAAQRFGAADLDFKVAGNQLQHFAAFAQQHVRENRQRLAAFYHACD